MEIFVGIFFNDTSEIFDLSSFKILSNNPIQFMIYFLRYLFQEASYQKYHQINHLFGFQYFETFLPLLIHLMNEKKNYERDKSEVTLYHKRYWDFCFSQLDFRYTCLEPVKNLFPSYKKLFNFILLNSYGGLYSSLYEYWIKILSWRKSSFSFSQSSRWRPFALAVFTTNFNPTSKSMLILQPQEDVF